MLMKYILIIKFFENKTLHFPIYVGWVVTRASWWRNSLKFLGVTLENFLLGTERFFTWAFRNVKFWQVSNQSKHL